MTLSTHPAQVQFVGMAFDRLDIQAAKRAVHALSNGEAFSYLVTPNVDHVVRLHREAGNGTLWSAYHGAALRLCDSRVLQALAKLSGLELGLVRGSDLTAQLLSPSEGLREVAVIGGDAGLIAELRSGLPGIAWHHHAPPQGVLRDPRAQQEIVTFIEACPARVFFLAIGSPQSELICARVAQRQRARGVALCVGASLEFLTGAKRRAPVPMQRAGLEWLFRLASEPRRLWRRYLVEGPAIFRVWWRWHVSSRR